MPDLKTYTCLLDTPWVATGNSVKGTWCEDGTQYTIEVGHSALAEALCLMQHNAFEAYNEVNRLKAELESARARCVALGL